MAELSPILAELERMVPLLAERYDIDLSGDNLPPVVTLASKGKKRTQVGWYTQAVWVDSQEDVLAALAGVNTADRVLQARAEVVLATELLGDPVQTVSELLRQLIVHKYEATSSWARNRYAIGANGYYPIAWSRLGYQYGHKVGVLDTQPHRGWAAWVPNTTFVEWVKLTLNENVFDVARNSEKPAEKKGSRMKKWECNCTVIRSATRVNGHCDECGAQFRWAEKEAPPRASYFTGEPDVPTTEDWVVAYGNGTTNTLEGGVTA